MTTNYYRVNGKIRGESTNGVRINYLHDALGSVTATTNEAGTVINTYRYKPSGAQLNKTGVGADPKFLWNGAHGYRQASGSLAYVRARHYSSDVNAWTTVDNLWPVEPPYVYVRNRPITWFDYSGLRECDCCCCPVEIDFEAVRCYGPGGDTPQCWWSTGFAKEWRGHNLTVDLRMTWQEVKEGATGDHRCRLDWEETFTVNGVPQLVQGFEGSVQHNQWKKCFDRFIVPPKECNFGWWCEITDQPGFAPYRGPPPRYFDAHAKRVITVTLYPGRNCDCEPVTEYWTQDMDWTKPGDPDPWIP